MRPYYIVTGILLILPIIDFAVAAPVSVQEKPQLGVDAVHIPEDAIIMLKRGDEWKLWLDILRYDLAKAKGAKPESSSSPPSGPAHGSTGVEQPAPPSVPKEPSPVSSPDHAPPSPGSSGYVPMDLEATPGPSRSGLFASSTVSEQELKRLLDIVDI